MNHLPFNTKLKAFTVHMHMHMFNEKFTLNSKFIAHIIRGHQVCSLSTLFSCLHPHHRHRRHQSSLTPSIIDLVFHNLGVYMHKNHQSTFER